MQVAVQLSSHESVSFIKANASMVVNLSHMIMSMLSHYLTMHVTKYGMMPNSLALLRSIYIIIK